MYKLVITKEVKNEIDYLHSKITGEWSGVLAYTPTKIDYENEDFEFETLGIYLMDIGTSVSTSFNYKDIDKISKYFSKKCGNKPILLGSIHTHHSMGAFISGVDETEIRDNTLVYNNYLFLVVDTVDKYTARFGRKAIIDEYKISYIDLNGKVVRRTVKGNNRNVEIKEVMIKKPVEEITVTNEFIDVYNKLLEEKNKVSSGLESDYYSDYRNFGFFGEPLPPSGYYTTKKKNVKEKTVVPDAGVMALLVFLYSYNVALGEDYDDQDELDKTLIDGLEVVDSSTLYDSKEVKKELKDAINVVKDNFYQTATKESIAYRMKSVLLKIRNSFKNTLSEESLEVINILVKNLEEL